ncbi:MAG: HAD family phosphatase [Firmicutes bacterium]|nr:HAD family phosphatase [Bacillota bacterium]
MLTDKKVIIFDMDGTLIDSVGIWNDVDRALVEKLGGDPADTDIQARRDDAMRRHHTAENPYLEYCAELGEIYDSPLSPEEIFKTRYGIAQHFLKEVMDYKPDADVFIKELKSRGYTLAIASTTRRNNLDIYRTQNENFLKKAPIDEYFSVVYAREDAVKTKPDPEIYLKVMNTLKVSPEECLIFEDSLIGLEAAKASGAQTAVIYDRYSDADREALNAMADYTFDTYAEALATISK